MSVDLRTCKPGDKLLTKHGTILTYVGLNERYLCAEYPHCIKYPDGIVDVRTDEGLMFCFGSFPEDEDIVEILK